MLLTGGTSPVWADAATLILSSDITAVVVALLLLVSWAAAGAIRVRAAIPTAPTLTCLSAGPLVHVGLPTRWTRTPTGEPAGLVTAAASVSLMAVGPASAGALIFLLARGHTPLGLNTPTVAAGAAVAGAAAAVTVARQRYRSRSAAHRWLARRGPHLGVATLLGEVGLSLATAATATALTHTEGTVISALEVLAAATVARLLTLLRHPPGGLLVADAVLVGLLMGVGASAGSALATVILWRLGMLIVSLGSALLMRRLPAPVPMDVAPVEHPTSSTIGAVAHRTVFRLLATLPKSVARRLRNLVFHILFSLADDPWQYSTMPYEARKRAWLVSSVDPHASTIVEVGCADGHNLRALAQAHPHARVIGLDISARAVHAARERCAGLPQVTVIHTDIHRAGWALSDAGVGRVDALVLSEVLYYLGAAEQVEAELRNLRAVLADQSLVVLLHPTADAQRLHAAAFRALDATVQHRQHIPDPARPILLEQGRTRPGVEQRDC